jgi:DNA-binding NarL/FixJ family response regulator
MHVMEGVHPTVRTLVVDDHEVVREGVAALLTAAGDISVCGQAGSVTEAVELAVATRPDVVLMDVRLTDGSGIAATRDIRARCPYTKVIMLTSFSDEDALLASIMAGASGYVLKQIRGSDLVGAVRHVAAGRSLLDPNVTSALFERLRKASTTLKDEKLASLSAREEEILTLVAQGRTNREIADDVGVSEKTVKNSISLILTKLQVARRSEAAAYLSRHTTLPGSCAG